MFRGSLVALITPFDEKHRVDEDALRQLIQWHIVENTHGIVLCGSTGEGIALSEEEKFRILKIAAEAANGKIPLILGTGTSDTRQTIEKTIRARDLGADGCLAVVPYYSKPSEKGIFQHFYALSKVGLPTIIYHHPGRTGLLLRPGFLSELAALPSVVGIKDSSGDPSIVHKVTSQSNVIFLSGDDNLTYPFMQNGAQGVISVIANALPRQWSELTNAVLTKDYSKALSIQKKFYKLNEILHKETNPQGIKFALSSMGRCQPFIRLPLTMPSNTLQKEIHGHLKALEVISSCS